uniref:Uncharacterized protein n=1 Tax=viral metagenome TaxID=1070528 RepID=A0A6M3JNQ1_9ZZZZ
MDRAAYEEVLTIIDVLKQKYVPTEGVKGQSSGQLGFDYGYHQALIEVQAHVQSATISSIVAKVRGEIKR